MPVNTNIAEHMPPTSAREADENEICGQNAMRVKAQLVLANCWPRNEIKIAFIRFASDIRW